MPREKDGEAERVTEKDEAKNCEVERMTTERGREEEEKMRRGVQHKYLKERKKEKEMTHCLQ